MVCTGLTYQQAVDCGMPRAHRFKYQFKNYLMHGMVHHMAGRNEAQNTIGAWAIPGSTPGLATKKAPLERGLSKKETQN
jgi:hypothetical protein